MGGGPFSFSPYYGTPSSRPAFVESRFPRRLEQAMEPILRIRPPFLSQEGKTRTGSSGGAPILQGRRMAPTPPET